MLLGGVQSFRSTARGHQKLPEPREMGAVYGMSGQVELYDEY
jgi:hypothetical protein